MTLKTLLSLLDSLSAFALQESWDNCGLNVGSLSCEINSIVLSIDCDEALIDRLEPESLIITHHPLIFGGLKTVNYDSYPSNLLRKMVQKNIALIAMHTNFDKTHLNRHVVEEVLKYPLIESEDYVCRFKVEESFEHFSLKVANAFGLKQIKTVQCSEYVQECSLVTGSGGSFIPSIQTDCFLTGDIKYHDAMAAKSCGVSLIDIGHYESECFFADILYNELKLKGIEATISNSNNPFTYLS